MNSTAASSNWLSVEATNFLRTSTMSLLTESDLAKVRIIGLSKVIIWVRIV